MNRKENMNNSKSNTLIFIAIVMMAISFFAVYFGRTLPNIDKIDTVIQRDTIRYVDTLTIFKEKPILKIVKETKIDTFYTKYGKDTILKTENKQYQDTFTCQKDSIIIQNFISGINSKLDSTKVNWKRQETIITNTVEITKYINKKKTFFDRFHIGIQGGLGYGLINNKPDIYLGIGGSVDL